MGSQLQHYGTLRGADVITDHGAEYVVIVQRIPTSIIPQLVVSIFSFIRTFLRFLGSPSSAAPEKKKREKEKKVRGLRVDFRSCTKCSFMRRKENNVETRDLRKFKIYRTRIGKNDSRTFRLLPLLSLWRLICRSLSFPMAGLRHQCLSVRVRN